MSAEPRGDPCHQWAQELQVTFGELFSSWATWRRKCNDTRPPDHHHPLRLLLCSRPGFTAPSTRTPPLDRQNLTLPPLLSESAHEEVTARPMDGPIAPGSSRGLSGLDAPGRSPACSSRF